MPAIMRKPALLLLLVALPLATLGAVIYAQSTKDQIAPRLIEATPADGKKIKLTNPVIAVILNRPVVPIKTAARMANLPPLLNSVPDTEGEGKWLTTSIYTFKPKNLTGGTNYTITINKGLTDVT